ncbi:MAG: sulfatase-like hydrolase/transferase [Verrucomicrobiia bacterium]
MSSPPNILWICTDQQRFDTIRALGNEYAQTPHLDELIEQGTAFNHAYCQSPVCAPSRASFLTGRYPRTTRCRQNGQSIPADWRENFIWPPVQMGRLKNERMTGTTRFIGRIIHNRIGKKMNTPNG